MELIKESSVFLMEMRQDIIYSLGVADSLAFCPTQIKEGDCGGRMVSPEMKEESCLHCSRKMNRDLIENLSLKCKAMAIKPMSFNIPS